MHWSLGSLGVAALLQSCGPAPLDVIAASGAAGSAGAASQGGTSAMNLGGAAANPNAAGAAREAEPPHFGAPTLIAELVAAEEHDDPTLTSDQLEMFFSAARAGAKDIYTSTRRSRLDAWGAPAPVAELSSDFLDATPGVAPDGLEIWFESTRAAGNDDLSNTDIWKSVRAGRDAPWSAPVLVEELSTPGRDSYPQPSSRLLITFSSWRSGGRGDTDLFAAVRPTVDMPWGAATPLSEVSSETWDEGLLRADGTQIFISSARSPGQGGGDLFWSARPSLMSPFANSVPIVDLNSPAQEQDLWVSENLDYAVFASNRSGHLDLYEAHAVP